MMLPTIPIIVFAVLTLAMLLTLDWFIGGLVYACRPRPLALTESPSELTDTIRQAA